MMNGFGIESIIAHNPMPLLLSLPLIPWLLYRHSIVTKVAHCMRSTRSDCTKANSWMSLIHENVEDYQRDSTCMALYSPAPLLAARCDAISSLSDHDMSNSVLKTRYHFMRSANGLR